MAAGGRRPLGGDCLARRMARAGHTEPQVELGELGPTLAAVAIAVIVLWLLPIGAALVHSRRAPPLSAPEAVVGSLRVATEGHWSEPQRAYPRRARPTMPNGAGWWLAAGAPLLALAGAGGLVWRRADRLRARARLGRRPYDPRGARPRDWGRPRDLGELVVRRRSSERFTFGWLDRRLLASDPEAQVCLVAPPRAGKSTRFVVPWALEHDGPAVVTSTKLDLFDATSRARERKGAVHVWDPFASASACWTPIEGCEDWGRALRQGHWLADAVGDGEHPAARFWNSEASKLLAPLLHAAALAQQGMDTVLRWIDQQDEDGPAALLSDAGDPAAAHQLEAVLGLDPRNRSTTFMSAGHLIEAYRYPEVLRTARPGLSAEEFLNGEANTLYLCASARHQRLHAPLIVAIIAAILERAKERARAGDTCSPPLRLLLDETANIAPLADLPQQLSEAGGQGIRFATVWQSLGQMIDRYRDAADAVLASSTAKLFMGPVTDEATRRYVSGALGEELKKHHHEHRSWRPKAGPTELQQLERDRALLINGTLAPAVIRVAPYWELRDLKRLAA
jgi:type IV secretion system protein VirD4